MNPRFTERFSRKYHHLLENRGFRSVIDFLWFPEHGPPVRMPAAPEFPICQMTDGMVGDGSAVINDREHSESRFSDDKRSERILLMESGWATLHQFCQHRRHR
jgi:hypothetical protein